MTKTGQAATIERPRCKRVTFRFEGGPKSDVRVAGDFNHWDPSAHRLNRKVGSATYTATFPLPVGRHEYKFVVDGEWQCDPSCAEQVPNEHGTQNCLIEIR